LLGAMAVVLAMPPWTQVAWADAPIVQGWWTTANNSAVTSQLPPDVAPAGAAPDVPPNGLLVQAADSASSPSAFAALVYPVESGTFAQTLTLEVAPNSVTTPSSTLKACPLTVPRFSPAQGGPMSQAPAFDCSRFVTATPTDGTYRFDVLALASHDFLSVAILPASAGDRVVLTQPGAESLFLGQGAESPVLTEPPEEKGGGPVSAPLVSGLPGTGVPLPRLPVREPATASVPAVALATGPSITSPATAVALSGPAARPRTVAVVLILVAMAALLWRAAGSEPAS